MDLLQVLVDSIRDGLRVILTCLKGIQEEELALMDVVIDAVETGQGDGPPEMRAGLVLTKMLSGVPPIMEPMRDAKQDLEDRLGIDLSGQNAPSR